MRVRAFALSALVLVGLVVSGPAQDGSGAQEAPTGQITPQQVKLGLDSIKASEALKKVATLASDKFEGRNSGYAGCWKAAEWIAERFKELKLKPIGDDGTYFQQFTFSARGARSPAAAQPGKSKKKKKKKKRKKQPKGALEKPHHAEPTTRNVVALLVGSDPVLKNEVIILGAHYDHVGREGQWNRGSRRGRPKGRDDIWNGADDNASGTAVVMEVAEAFAASRIRPRRSILFILFAAEEHGLYGSKWYCDHPLFPIDKTAAMYNFDMVAYKKKKRILIAGVQHAKGGVVQKILQAALKQVRKLKASLRPWASSKSSDHAPFVEKNIPVVYFLAGVNKDYHTVHDEVKVCSGKRMADIAKVTFLSVLDLADLPEKPVFVRAPSAAAGASTLGITVSGPLNPDELKKLKLNKKYGGLKISDVHPGTPASDAGLEENDVILGLGKERLRRNREMPSLQAALRKLKPGKTFSIKILRAGKKKTLKTKLPR